MTTTKTTTFRINLVAGEKNVSEINVKVCSDVSVETLILEALQAGEDLQCYQLLSLYSSSHPSQYALYYTKVSRKCIDRKDCVRNLATKRLFLRPIMVAGERRRGAAPADSFTVARWWWLGLPFPWWFFCCNQD
ncbi:uncharacterized protein LOC127244426 [Andrographis paniculata]|uniref:uncharacterized protein LOC127244426 n=1 Tax=Andrographis paniculata TaxID=175694 RepID=UPI0021E7D206|nr:uncharacterized protein LOC127244426 [Andrographis paniculata]